MMPPPVRRCESIDVNVDALRPNVTLLVDQSGSMRAHYPTRDSSETRWSLVRNALLDPQTGVVKSLEHAVQFGLTFYTSRNGFSGGECPLLSQVRSATGNYAKIASLYDETSPDDDTPTGAAIRQVVTQMADAPRRGPEVLLLVTDGDPDTCEVPDPQMGQADAVAAAALAHSLGVDFYVLGISADISGENLQQLANAGQGRRIEATFGLDPDAAQPFLAGGDVAAVTAQLQGILARVPLCEVTLDRNVDSEELARGDVALDGEQLGFGDRDGFVQRDPRHLAIVGKACDSLRASGKRLRVRISCEPN